MLPEASRPQSPCLSFHGPLPEKPRSDLVPADVHPAKIRVLIVDDEPLARSNLVVLLRDDPEIGIVDECASGAEALGEIRVANPDLLFLDVQMPECDGFDVLELLGSALPPA